MDVLVVDVLLVVDVMKEETTSVFPPESPHAVNVARDTTISRSIAGRFIVAPPSPPDRISNLGGG